MKASIIHRFLWRSSCVNMRLRFASLGFSVNISVACSVLVRGFPVLLFAAMSTLSFSVCADIRDTKHNLSGGPKVAAGEQSKEMRDKEVREICVFCHAPNAKEDAGGQAAVGVTPKWQKNVDIAFSFEMFDDIGRMGVDQEGGGIKVGSVSVACLSCHDGVQAFGVTPGAGSDHPFGVPYRGITRGGEAASKYRDRILVAQDAPVQTGRYLDDNSEFRPARSGMINKRTIWWASLSPARQRTKNDLPLYPRRVVEGAGNYELVPFVECTSCHDPHSTREVFLRTGNEGSTLCFTCHVK